MKTHDPVAKLPLCDSRTHGNDGAGNLMPKNLRSRDKTVLDLFDVRAANPASSDSYQDFARRDPGHGNVFHDHAPFAAVHGRAHRGRNGLRRERCFEHGAGAAHCAATRPGSIGISLSPSIPA